MRVEWFEGGMPVGCTGDRLLGLASPDWLLPAWLVITAIGVLLALGVRSIQAPKPAQS